MRRWAPAASALLFTLNQVASGPEDDALGYSDYAQYDLGQAVAHLTVQASALGLGVHQFAAFDHDGLAGAGRRAAALAGHHRPRGRAPPSSPTLAPQRTPAARSLRPRLRRRGSVSRWPGLIVGDAASSGLPGVEQLPFPVQ